MATTLQIESFNEINLGERTTLTEPALAGDEVLTVKSTEDYEVGHALYVGQLSREGCEKAVVASIDSPTAIGLVDELELSHTLFEVVTAVTGDSIHIYRAADVDGSVPGDETFSLLATRQIDPDQLSTYYRDSTGSSAFWYRFTYYNAATGDETSLQDSTPVRGDDFGHYASLSQIRSEAGFTNALNLKDNDVDQQRRAAESEINSTLAASYTVPFNPVPAAINTLTIKLAAAMLLVWAYGLTAEYKALLKDARDAIQAAIVIGEDGVSTASSGISSWPDDTAPRSFTIDQRF